MKKKTRGKRPYRPKKVEIPGIMVRLLPPLTEVEHEKLDLAGMLPLDAIRRGEGNSDNASSVLCAIKSGYVLSTYFDEGGNDEETSSQNPKWQIRLLMMIAYAEVLVAEELIRQGKPEAVKPWMCGAAQDALQIIADMERQVTRPELSKAARFTLANRQRIRMCGLHQVRIVDPAKPETWTDVMDWKGIAYLHGSALSGLLQVKGDFPYWINPPRDIQIRIEEPVIVVRSERMAEEMEENLGTEATLWKENSR